MPNHIVGSLHNVDGGGCPHVTWWLDVDTTEVGPEAVGPTSVACVTRGTAEGANWGKGW